MPLSFWRADSSALTFRLNRAAPKAFLVLTTKPTTLKGREDFLRFFTRAFVALEQHNHSLRAFGVEVHGGIVDRVDYISFFHKVHDLLCRHDCAVVFGFRRACAEVGRADYVFAIKQLRCGKIGDVSVDLAAFAGLYNAFVVYELSSRTVDYVHSVFHFGDALAVDEAARFVGERNVERQIVWKARTYRRCCRVFSRPRGEWTPPPLSGRGRPRAPSCRAREQPPRQGVRLRRVP